MGVRNGGLANQKWAWPFGYSEAPASATVVWSVTASADWKGAFIRYRISNGVNVRTGTLALAWDGTNVQMKEEVTFDLGDTSGVAFTAAIASGVVQLTMTCGTASWDLNALVDTL